MIYSFGYNEGDPPSRAAKVFDVRHVTHDTTSPEFVQQMLDIVTYAKAHPSESIAIGCKAGKHRSVTMANQVATRARTSVLHRDK